MIIQGKFGTVTVHPPLQPATAADEKRLYSVLIECLIEKTDPKAIADQSPQPGAKKMQF